MAIYKSNDYPYLKHKMNRYFLKPTLVALVCLIYGTSAFSTIRLPTLFTDNMVLQQKASDPVWGWADPGTQIHVTGSWPGAKAASGTADADGKWKVNIKTPGAGGPYTLTINGKETIVLHNVLIGEVWVCSGQSNMEMPVSGWSGAPLLHSSEEIQQAKYPEIRLFTVKRDIALSPQDTCTGSWSECSPQTVGAFSATAYFFGRDLFRKLKVPIGLIHTSWGGTVAEAWTSAQALQKLGDFNAKLGQVDSIRMHAKEGTLKNPNMPTVLYNGMIAPLIPFGIKGAIWYQGEANVGRAKQYERLFPTMINDWRTRWKEGNFPFYFVQIAPYPYGGDSTKSAALRDAQRKSLSTPHTGMVVTLDIGNPKNIHPANKQEVGRRLSLWALANTYHQKGIVYSGPLYKALKVKGSKAIVSFNHADKGLVAKGGGLDWFEVAGRDGKFVPGHAVISGNQVIVTSPEVSQPAAVRYGWKDTAEPHLFNKAGLPASSFSSLPLQ